jgi:hypothetical protein
MVASPKLGGGGGFTTLGIQSTSDATVMSFRIWEHILCSQRVRCSRAPTLKKHLKKFMKNMSG